MKNRNIVLIGFMGSGKSVVSNKLAKKLKRKIISTDQMVESREGRKISEIFKQDGEPYFRQLESEAAKEISGIEGGVIDCGGGIVMNPENLSRLRENGTLIYLSASADTIMDRIGKSTHRPIINTADPKARVEELLAERKPVYEQADYAIDTDGKTIDEVCETILSKLSNE